MKRTVFISHASADKATADQVCKFLETHGTPCWIAPRDVTPGKNYGLAIVDAIDECDVFVLLLTSESNKSSQVVREVERAASANAIMIPLRTEDVQPSRNLEFYVSSAHWLDAITRPLEPHLRQLLQAIKNWQAAEVAKEESNTTVVTAPRAEAAAPPPSAAAAAPSSSANNRGKVLAIIAGVFLLGLLLVFGLTRHSAEPPSVATATAIPVATTSPTATLTATAAATATASVTATPIETPTVPAGGRRRPGEPLHSPTANEAESSPAGSAPALRPGQSSGAAPAVREVVASSQRGPEHRPGLAVDGDVKTSWMTKSEGVNQSLSVNFKTPSTISSVSIVNGNNLDEERFRATNRARSVRLMLSDGSIQVLQLEDKMGPQHFEISHRLASEWVKIEILSVYRGKRNNWTAISEIQFNR